MSGFKRKRFFFDFAKERHAAAETCFDLAIRVKVFKVKLQGLIVKNVLVEDWD